MKSHHKLALVLLMAVMFIPNIAGASSSAPEPSHPNVIKEMFKNPEVDYVRVRFTAQSTEWYTSFVDLGPGVPSKQVDQKILEGIKWSPLKEALVYSYMEYRDGKKVVIENNLSKYKQVAERPHEAGYTDEEFANIIVDPNNPNVTTTKDAINSSNTNTDQKPTTDSKPNTKPESKPSDTTKNTKPATNNQTSNKPKNTTPNKPVGKVEDTAQEEPANIADETGLTEEVEETVEEIVAPTFKGTNFFNIFVEGDYIIIEKTTDIEIPRIELVAVKNGETVFEGSINDEDYAIRGAGKWDITITYGNSSLIDKETINVTLDVDDKDEEISGDENVEESIPWYTRLWRFIKGLFTK